MKVENSFIEDISMPRKLVDIETDIYKQKYEKCESLVELKRSYMQDIIKIESLDRYSNTRKGIASRVCGNVLIRRIGWLVSELSANEYQRLASRTINRSLENSENEYHALHGMAGEIGEIHSIYQKSYQGHPMKKDHLRKEVGDLLWFIAEYCTVMGWNIGDVMVDNIRKIKKRYPEGFDPERSVHRQKGDI